MAVKQVDPTPEQIERRAERIRRKWTDQERRLRFGIRKDGPKHKPPAGIRVIPVSLIGSAYADSVLTDNS